MLLSLAPSISSTTALIGADSTEARTPASAGTVPTPEPPATVMPRAWRSWTSSRAAPSDGSPALNSSPVWRASLTSSASYGPASITWTSVDQLGAKNSSS